MLLEKASDGGLRRGFTSLALLYVVPQPARGSVSLIGTDRNGYLVYLAVLSMADIRAAQPSVGRSQSHAMAELNQGSLDRGLSHKP